MATYRLFPSTSGPASAVNHSGNFLSGVVFAVAAGGNWFQGYWWWVAASGQSTAPVKCALWSPSDLNNGKLVAGSVVTSGALTAGQWNYIPLATPVQLAPSYDSNYPKNGSAYIAAIGVNGSFPDTGSFWSAAIDNGPLHAYPGGGGTNGCPYTLSQGVFTIGGSDPSTTMPGQSSGTDNFWVDVQISDTAPVGYSGTYRLWPNKGDANQVTSGDAAVNYLIATEVHLTGAASLNNIWYYSPAGTTQLATWIGIWSIAGPNSGSIAAQNSSPSWSGAAGSGWVAASINGTLAPGNYKVSVYNGAASPDSWSAKDANSGYFDLGVAANGITWGPLTAPQLSQGSAAYQYGGPDTASPPYSLGSVTHAQSTFSKPATSITMPAYPYLYATVTADTDSSNAIHTQNYWVDLEITPISTPASSGLLLTGIV